MGCNGWMGSMSCKRKERWQSQEGAKEQKSKRKRQESRLKVKEEGAREPKPGCTDSSYKALTSTRKSAEQPHGALLSIYPRWLQLDISFSPPRLIPRPFLPSLPALVRALHAFACVRLVLASRLFTVKSRPLTSSGYRTRGFSQLLSSHFRQMTGSSNRCHSLSGRSGVSLPL